MSITPPTPAEVAEARAFLTAVDTVSVESFMVLLEHSETYRRHAAVLVRDALAAPAGLRQGIRRALGIDDGVKVDDAGLVADVVERVRWARWCHDEHQITKAAPAEQPREDPCSIPGCGGDLTARERPGYRCGDHAARSVSESQSPSAVPAADLSDELEAARVYFAREIDAVAYPEVTQEARLHAAVVLRAFTSGALSAVPAVSAGGAGRDLTAQDVRDALVVVWGRVESWRESVAEQLNRIARPAGTGTQATEQTTEAHVEWLTIGTDEDGDVGAETFESAAAAEQAAQRWRHWMTDVHVERHEVTTSRSVSPWSPVDVHDESGAQA